MKGPTNDIEDGNDKHKLRNTRRIKSRKATRPLRIQKRIDLRNLLDLVKAIAENEKLVKDLDKELAQGLLLALLEQLPWVPI